jgi:virginiamycin B lyase
MTMISRSDKLNIINKNSVLVFLIALIFPFTAKCQIIKEPDTLSISKVAFSEFKLKGYPDFLTTDGNDVWVLNKNRIEKLSDKLKKPILTVDIPNACGGLIVGYHSIWVANCKDQSIYRVDKKTGKVLAIIKCGIADLKGEISLAAGNNAIWVLSDSIGVLTRINVKSNKIEARIKVIPNSFCAIYKYNSVWITNTALGCVQRIDPKSNRITANIAVGSSPRFLAAGENGVWVLNQGEGSVSRIDPKSNKMIATINTNVPGTGGDIVTGAGLIWVRATKGRFLQTINPKNNQILNIYTPLSGSGAVRVAGKNIWVTAHDINTVWILKN